MAQFQSARPRVRTRRYLDFIVVVERQFQSARPRVRTRQAEAFAGWVRRLFQSARPRVRTRQSPTPVAKSSTCFNPRALG